VFEEIFLAWIQLIILAPISALTSYAFDKIILAPTSTYVQDQLMVNHGTSIVRQRMSQIGNGIRRMSLAVGNQARRLNSVFASKVSDVPASNPSQTDTETDKLNRQNAEIQRSQLSDALIRANIATAQAEAKGLAVLNSLTSPFVSGGNVSSIDRAINSLNDPNAKPYTGDDPIIKARLARANGNDKFKNPEIFTNGVTADKANQLFANDLTKNESGVKTMLSGAGVSKLPQNAFDSLVSYQNQIGNASYAYVKGEKIDLTSMYKNGEWDRAAGFIAADERDRPRRIQEAAIMANNSYGKIATEEQVINQGLSRSSELIRKDQLNKQSGNSVTPQQAFALGSSYLAQTGSTLPGLSFPTNSVIKANSLTGDITQVLKKQRGPWPY
jgi:hypothetical protein